MANELQSSGLTSGVTYYAVIRSGAQYWNAATPAFENYNASNWADYAIDAAAANTAGDWVGSFPSGIAAGLYGSELRQQVGDEPAIGDPLAAGPDTMDWTGTAEASVAAIVSRVNTALPDAAPAAAGGLPTIGTGAGQIQPDGQGNVSLSAAAVSGVWSALTSALTTANSIGKALVSFLLPSGPNQLLGQLTTTDGQGNPTGGMTLNFALQAFANGTTTGAASSKTFRLTSAAGGTLQGLFEAGCTYVGWADGGVPQPFTVPSSGSTFALPAILGRFA